MTVLVIIRTDSPTLDESTLADLASQLLALGNLRRRGVVVPSEVVETLGIELPEGGVS